MALLPAIDSTKVVGPIALPGNAMTGLILAGVEPIVAVRYQIVVMYIFARGSLGQRDRRLAPVPACAVRRGRSAIPGAGSLINAQVGIPTAALVFVDHDVNAMVIGERRARFPHVDDLLPSRWGQVSEPASSPRANPARRAKAPPATSDTSAQTFTAEKIRRCAAAGNRCVEAYAGGWAIMRDLRRGPRCGVGRRRRGCGAKGDAVATRLVREAGRVLGASVVADAVGLLNPAVIVIAGQLFATGEHLLAGIRERIYSRSLPPAMRRPADHRKQPRRDSGVLGLANGVLDRLFTFEHLNAALASTG